MYRCTECNAEYQECPEYCECGNDTFEETADEIYEDAAEYDYAEDEQENTASETADERETLTIEQIKEIEAEKLDKIKSLTAGAVILVLCVLVFVLPPHRKQKPETESGAASVQKTAKLPSVQTYWDDSVPSAFRNKDPYANLPLLNSRLGSLPPALREYLVSIGKYFNRKWDTQYVQGAGSCRVQFVINKEGGLITKTIISSSGNQDLDDSVSLLLTNTTGFNIPPDDYKGEKVYILFSIDKNGASKVSYPSK